MEPDWRRFFHCQRNALKLSLCSGKTAVFDDAAKVFSREYGLVSVRWDITIDDGAWKTVCSWQQTSTLPADNELISREVLFAGPRRQHRFMLRLRASAGDLAEPTAFAICSTLKTAAELHDEHEMHLADVRGGGDELGHAAVDADGNVLHANERFVSLVCRSQPDWDARKLPMPLDQSPATLRHGMTWKGLFFYVEPNALHIRLRVRPDRRLPDLSPRELEVARLIASGMTFKEVSQRLDMAPSTASTHLYKVYDKLGINRRSALVEWLNEYAESLKQPRKAS